MAESDESGVAAHHPPPEAPSDQLVARLRRRLDEELPRATVLRHQLHRHPEPSGREEPTLRRVLAALPAGAAPVRVAGTGAVVRLGPAGPAVAVRAELDALAVSEATGAPWASRHAAVMHACGHDLHLAALVALCRAVAAVGGPAPLLAVLQPREETYPSGARDIRESGLLADEQVRAVLGAHVQPTLPVGTVACTPGPVNASADEFTLTVAGVGGHAAYPHLTDDPVLALAHVVVALQSLVSRRVDPMDPAVLTVTTLRAGTAANVTPELATARGTVRAIEPRTRDEVLRRLPEVAALTARAHGCEAEVELTAGEPALVNDTELAARTAALLRGRGVAVDDTLRSAGSDDFAYYGARLPTLMMFVGVGGQCGERRLHSARFLPADTLLADLAHAMLDGYLAAAASRPEPGASTSRGELW